MANRNQNRNDYDKTANLVVENAEIIFRNFRGIDRGYNPKHEKSFSLLVKPERFDIEAMKNDGWNLKALKPREGYEDEPVNYHLPVTVRFDNFPPRIYLVTKVSNEGEKPRYRKTLLDEESAFMIDTAEIANVNLEISHGKTYDFNGKVGVKAYLKTMYIELVEDRFDSLYDFVDDDDECPFD